MDIEKRKSTDEDRKKYSIVWVVYNIHKTKHNTLQRRKMTISTERCRNKRRIADKRRESVEETT